ncbi:hypothetical protein IIA16_03175 [bacterium]|nr:hypothetical protein [bacterium]
MKRTPALLILALGALSAAPMGDTPTVEDLVTDTALTLYNDGTGLVRQTLRATLPVGTDVGWSLSGLAQTLEPPTVRLVSAGADGDLSVREQNFEYDLVNPQKLLARYLGMEVSFEVTNPATGDISRLFGTILSTAGSGVYEIEGEIHLGAPGRIILPALPGGLALRPSLRWRLSNSVSGPQDLEFSYLMRGTKWWADYTLLIGPDNTADLVGWVTLQNQSGTGYPEARIKLIAGTVHRAPVAPMARSLGAYAMAEDAVSQEALFEYHMYTLPGTTDLPDRSQKQVRFLEGEDVPVERIYTLANPYGWSGPSNEAGDPARVPIVVTMRFVNSESAGLGLPLPAGTIRMFMADSDGAMQLIGEDRVAHTPRDESVSLRAGEAFDVVGEIKTLAMRKIYGNRTDTDVEVRVRNRKEEAITVRYRARIWGDVTILSARPYPLTPVGNGWYEAAIPVEPGEEAVLTYTVRRN